MDSLEKIFLNHHFNESEKNLESLFDSIFLDENFILTDEENKPCKDRESALTQLHLHYKKFLRRLPILRKLELF